MDKIQVLAFRLDGFEFAFTMDKVVEITDPKEVIPCPLAPSHLEGIFNLRGNIVPLFNLKKRLLLSGEKEPEEFFIILSPYQKRVFACRVGQILGVFDTERADIERVPQGIEEDIARSLVKGQVVIGRRKFILLDPLKIPEEISLGGSIPLKSDIQ